MEHSIKVDDTTYKVIQNIKRLHIEKFGEPISDGRAIKGATFLFVMLSLYPDRDAQELYESAVIVISHNLIGE